MHQVDPAIFGDDPRDGGGDRGFLGDVEAQREADAARRVDALDQGFRARLVDVGDHYLGAFRRQSPRGDRAHPRRAARAQRHFAFVSSHVLLPFVVPVSVAGNNRRTKRFRTVLISFVRRMKCDMDLCPT